jgi:hypothetical protein
MLYAVHTFTLLRYTKIYAHCLQLHICISVTPTCFGGEAFIVRGTEGHSLRSAAEEWRSLWPLVPPDDGGLITETCRDDTDTNV